MSKREDTDFKLFELIEDPAENYYVNLYYLGWERTSSSQYSGFCIHHPNFMGVVLPKMISISQIYIDNFPYAICWGEYPSCESGISLPNTHWKVIFTRGIAFGGSSGSPLLNHHCRVIGQLHGGILWPPLGCPPPTDTNYVKYFGRLDLSWYGRNSSERLKDWLDPLGTDDVLINGLPLCRKHLINQTISTNLDVAGCGILHVQDIFITRNAKVNVTAAQEITIQDAFHAEAGTTVSFSITSSKQTMEKTPNIVIEETQVNAENLQNNTMSGNNLTVSRHQFYLLPNPNRGTFQVETNFPLSEISHLKITNTLGLTVYETKSIASNEIQLPNSVSGLYFVVMVLKDGTVLTQKMMVQK